MWRKFSLDNPVILFLNVMLGEAPGRYTADDSGKCSNSIGYTGLSEETTQMGINNRVS